MGFYTQSIDYQLFLKEYDLRTEGLLWPYAWLCGFSMCSLQLSMSLGKGNNGVQKKTLVSYPKKTTPSLPCEPSYVVPQRA